MELVEWDGEGAMGWGYIDREMVGDIDGNRWEYNSIYTLNGND